MQTQQLIYISGFILGVATFVFNGVGKYLKDKDNTGSQITSTKESDIILAKDIQLLRSELGGKVETLVTTIGLEMRNLTDAFHLIKQNDLHSITTKQIDQDSQINKLTNAIVELKTIIDERVPRKTVDMIS